VVLLAVAGKTERLGALDPLKEKSTLSFAVSALVASGGIGFILSNLHHAAYCDDLSLAAVSAPVGSSCIDLRSMFAQAEARHPPYLTLRLHDGTPVPATQLSPQGAWGSHMQLVSHAGECRRC